MPSLPLPEAIEEEESNAEVIRNVARQTVAASVPEEIGLRPWVAIIALLVVVTTNPAVPLAMVGALALVYLSYDISHRRKGLR